LLFEREAGVLEELGERGTVCSGRPAGREYLGPILKATP
jgi:hypothetical protein